MVAIVILMLLVGLAMGNFKAMLMQNSFRARIHEFVSAMESAAVAASQSDRRYEMVIDLIEQTYLLREITSPDLSEVLEEEIITEGSFGNNVIVEYVLFDDGEFADNARVKFRVGKSGFQYGGVIVMFDEDEMPHSVVVNRMSNVITVESGEVGIMYPLSKEELPF